MNGCLNMWIVPSWEQIIPMLMSVQVLQVCSDKEPQITTEAAEFLLDNSYFPKKYLDYIQGTFLFHIENTLLKKADWFIATSSLKNRWRNTCCRLPGKYCQGDKMIILIQGTKNF